MSPKQTNHITVSDLKQSVIVNAVATGNAFALRDLFSRLGETPDISDDSAAPPELLGHLGYLLPDDEAAESPEMKAAAELVEKCDFNDALPAVILEETAKRAVSLGKFAFAEDAYKLLGVKKEMIALYAQAGEQFLRDGEAKRGAMSFFVAASIEQPLGQRFQLIGPRLHAKCLEQPDKCVTEFPIEELIEKGIHVLLANESLSEKLIASAQADHKAHALATLAVCRDMDLPALATNIRAATAELSNIDNSKPGDYAPLGPTLLGRKTGSDEAWQYLRELSFEHPIAALCVCLKFVKDTPVIVPVIRDGAPLIDLLLPEEFLKA